MLGQTGEPGRVRAEEDAELVKCVRGVRAGESACFEKLYLLTRDRVRFFLLSRGLSGDDLEEVFSESYIVVFEAAGRFRGKSSVMTWVLGIVNVKCKEYYRKRRADSELPELPDRGDFESRTALSMDIREAVRSLDAEEYPIFVYKLCLRMTYGEISRVLHIPVSTLKRNVSHIREKLQTRLAGPRRF